MQHLARFTLWGSIAVVTACSGTTEQDNLKLSRQSDTLAIPYAQDWETGSAGWSSAPGKAVKLTNDSTSPSGPTVQQLDRATFGGDYFSPFLPVNALQMYCVSAKIKWVSGAAPFIGIEHIDSVSVGISWVFGTAYSDAKGSTQVISSTDPEWQSLSRSVLMPARVNAIRLTDELYAGTAKAGPNLSYIDGLAITSGECPPHTQDWESGVGGWADKNGQGPTLVTDDTSKAGSMVQKLERATVGGDYFSPYVPVAGGQAYCVSANVRWVSGAAPFVGIEQTAGNEWLGINWLFGSTYTDGHGSTRAISRTETGWQNLSRTVFIPTSTSRIRLTDELYADGTKDGPNLSYIDGLAITRGACVLTQNWESGSGGWVDQNGQGPTLVTDGTSKAGPTVQQLDRATVGGDYFSQYVSVVGGQEYCVSTKIRWISGAAPFIGIEQSAGSESLGISWLFGTAYTDGHGSTQAISNTESGWQNLSRTILVSTTTTQIRLTDELYEDSAKDGANLSYTDGFSVVVGSCPIYKQDWEAGTGGWLSKARGLPALATDETSPTGRTVQKLDRTTTGGDFFSPYVPVVGGQTYCIGGNVRWISGASPYVGIEQVEGSVSLGVFWLVGGGSRDAHGWLQRISATEMGWQNLSRSVHIPMGTTQIRLTDELFAGTVKDGPPLGYFDGLSIAEGQCSRDYQEWQPGALALAVGWLHTCVITSSDGARCWGSNQNGQLGDGTTTDRSAPTSIDVLSGVKAIQAHRSHTCALMESGGVRCWGDNAYRQLGDGTITNRPSPPTSDMLTGVKAIAVGYGHTCALMESGGVRCWGDNAYGQLGDGTIANRPSPPTSDVLTGVKAIAVGYGHTCAHIESGGVRCWGNNQYGQLGDGTVTNRSSPPTSDVLTGVKAIAAGQQHTCALMEAGGVRCWGDNAYGQLGDGTTNGRFTPPDLDVLTGVKAIAVGVEHSCALMEAGGVRCWGDNAYGQLGDWTITNRLSPTASEVLTDVRAIAAGQQHTCALMEAGGVRCWGANDWGQLGDGTTTERLSPVEVMAP